MKSYKQLHISEGTDIVTAGLTGNTFLLMQMQSVRRDILTLLYIHIYTYKLYFNRTAAPMRKQKADFVNPQSCVCCAVLCRSTRRRFLFICLPFSTCSEKMSLTLQTPRLHAGVIPMNGILPFLYKCFYIYVKKCILVSLIIINIWKKQLHSLSVFNKEGEAFNESQHKTIHALGGVGRGWE